MNFERITRWLPFIFITAFLLQTILSMWDDSPTFDEMINPSVGYTELITGDLSLVHDHPPLIRVFTALPLLALKPNMPLNHDSWQKRAHGMQDRYDFAYQFFYISNDNADTILFWSRFPPVFLSLILGLLVFRWAKELFGVSAGLFSLFLYSFEPNIIVHSRLAINDLILALFVFSSIYLLWQYSKMPSLKYLALTGISFGLALLSKFSAVMLFPILFLILCCIYLTKNRFIPYLSSPLSSPSGILKTFFQISIIALSVVMIFYGAQWKLYIKGFYDTIAHYQVGHHAFLMGSYATDGWWYYFPVAFALKTPIPLLIFIIAAFLFLSFRKEKAEYFLLIPVAVIGMSALSSKLNIGLRHILPIYPFLIVIASSIVTVQFSRDSIAKAVFIVFSGWYLFSTISIFPSYLAYFNEFVGSKNGYMYLVDSNLDWGQDMKRLKIFMDKNKIDTIYLNYFGTANPCYYNMKFQSLPGTISCGTKHSKLPDMIAISATNLQAVYSSDKQSYSWLKGYKPVAHIGYSIFVYDIKKDASAHNNLGILYLRSGMIDETLSEFKEVVRLKPDEPVGHANLGFAYAVLSKFDKAEEELNKALTMDSNSSTAHAGFGVLYLNKGLNPKAEEAFKKALEKEPENIFVSDMLKTFNLKKGN